MSNGKLPDPRPEESFISTHEVNNLKSEIDKSFNTKHVDINESADNIEGENTVNAEVNNSNIEATLTTSNKEINENRKSESKDRDENQTNAKSDNPEKNTLTHGNEKSNSSNPVINGQTVEDSKTESKTEDKNPNVTKSNNLKENTLIPGNEGSDTYNSDVDDQTGESPKNKSKDNDENQTDIKSANSEENTLIPGNEGSDTYNSVVNDQIGESAKIGSKTDEKKSDTDSKDDCNKLPASTKDSDKKTNPQSPRSPSFKKRKNDIKCNPHVGLTNFGNNCYLNCVIQVLFVCQEFREGIINYPEDQSLSNENGGFTRDFKKLMEAMKSGYRYRTQEAIRTIVGYFLASDNGDDIQKCYQQIVTRINKATLKSEVIEYKGDDKAEKSFSKYKGRNHGFIFDLFYSQVSYKTVCESCNKVLSENFQLLNVFPIPIPTTSTSAKLSECLEDFLNKSSTDAAEDSTPCCPNPTLWSLSELTHLPKYIFMYVIRGSYVLGDDKNRTMVELDNSLYVPTKYGPVLFKLKAIVDHLGGTESGHYYSKCLHDKWLLCNDEQVEEISFEEVPSKHAVGFLMERCDTTPIKIPLKNSCVAAVLQMFYGCKEFKLFMINYLNNIKVSKLTMTKDEQFFNHFAEIMRGLEYRDEEMVKRNVEKIENYLHTKDDENMIFATFAQALHGLESHSEHDYINDLFSMKVKIKTNCNSCNKESEENSHTRHIFLNLEVNGISISLEESMKLFFGERDRTNTKMCDCSNTAQKSDQMEITTPSKYILIHIIRGVPLDFDEGFLLQDNLYRVQTIVSNENGQYYVTCYHNGWWKISYDGVEYISKTLKSCPNAVAIMAVHIDAESPTVLNDLVQKNNVVTVKKEVIDLSVTSDSAIVHGDDPNVDSDGHGTTNETQGRQIIAPNGTTDSINNDGAVAKINEGNVLADEGDPNNVVKSDVSSEQSIENEASPHTHENHDPTAPVHISMKNNGITPQSENEDKNDANFKSTSNNKNSESCNAVLDTTGSMIEPLDTRLCEHAATSDNDGGTATKHQCEVCNPSLPNVDNIDNTEMMRVDCVGENNSGGTNDCNIDNKDANDSNDHVTQDTKCEDTPPNQISDYNKDGGAMKVDIDQIDKYATISCKYMKRVLQAMLLCDQFRDRITTFHNKEEIHQIINDNGINITNDETHFIINICKLFSDMVCHKDIKEPMIIDCKYDCNSIGQCYDSLLFLLNKSMAKKIDVKTELMETVSAISSKNKWIYDTFIYESFFVQITSITQCSSCHFVHISSNENMLSIQLKIHTQQTDIQQSIDEYFIHLTTLNCKCCSTPSIITTKCLDPAPLYILLCMHNDESPSGEISNTAYEICDGYAVPVNNAKIMYTMLAIISCANGDYQIQRNVSLKEPKNDGVKLSHVVVLLLARLD